MNTLSIDGRLISSAHPAYIICEIGVNHDGDLLKAHKLIQAAAECGANAAKFQCFDPTALVAAGHSQRDMLTPLAFTEHDFRHLQAWCRENKITFLCSPFDDDSVDLLARIGVPAWKIPSGETVNYRLLARIAAYGQPMIVSTGMCNLAEVERAVEVIEKAGKRQYVLLHCTSSYPAPPESINLHAMKTLRQAFGCLVGFSDHSLGINVPIAAVAMGAKVVEKHMTLDKSAPGPDHRASLEPGEFYQMVLGIREVEKAMGDGIKRPSPAEQKTKDVARKSLVARQAIHAGQVITREMVDIKRPGTGLSPEVLYG